MKVIVVRGEEPKRGPDGKLILDDTPAEQDKPKRSHHKKKEPVKEEEVEKVEAEEVEVSEVTEKVKFTTGSNFINGDY
jgi:hypothetical protein